MSSHEKLWIDALLSRNNVAHAYNKAVALDIVNGVKGKYYQMFVDLRDEISENHSDFV